ncbi:hypothetical protein D9M69_547240 [compost metagenome]
MQPNVGQLLQLFEKRGATGRVPLPVDIEGADRQRQRDFVKQVRPLLRTDATGPEDDVPPLQCAGRHAFCGEVEPMHQFARNAIAPADLIKERLVVREHSGQIHPGPGQEVAGISTAH